MRDDPYLEIWELDLTTRDSKNKFNHLIKYDYQKSIEREIASYLQKNFS